MGAAVLEPGTVLGGSYRIVRVVGEGGMGQVYEAAHARLSGRYAVKVLQRELAAHPEAFARFKREAEITSGLRHPHIVNVIDFNQTPDGSPFLVMEFLEGEELTALMARGPMPLALTLDILGGIASALAAAHGKNVVHRDLKPANVFLVPVPGKKRPIAKVVDFGISKVRTITSAGLTRESAVMGTPQYMSPEQAMGRQNEIDARTDLFALAVMTYEMLTGRPPFSGDSLPAIMYQVVHEAPAPMSAGAVEVSPAVEAVVLRALAKAKEERFAGVVEFVEALEDAAGRATVVDRALADPRASIPPGPPASAPTTLQGSAGALSSPEAREAREVRPAVPRWPLVLVGLVGVAGVVAFAFRSPDRPRGEPPALAVAPPPAPAVVAPSALASPAPSAVPVLEPSAAPAPEPSAAPEEPTPTAETAPPPPAAAPQPTPAKKRAAKPSRPRPAAHPAPSGPAPPPRPRA